MGDRTTWPSVLESTTVVPEGFHLREELPRCTAGDIPKLRRIDLGQDYWSIGLEHRHSAAEHERLGSLDVDLHERDRRPKIRAVEGNHCDRPNLVA